uniref:RNA-directed DNA polymerase n=1 Tax=Caenorhabditis tropicalis TaxID=1561998 RepID=A0A1I7T583_9PELO
MVQFYGSFVKDLHNYRAPLDALTKKDAEFNWSKTCQKSFEKIKLVLQSDLLLTHYDPTLPIIVAADASNYGIGAVITHRFPDGSEKAIYHASRSLTTAQKGYSQIEKEALGLIVAIEKFHKYIHGRKFALRTDHKPLLAIFGSKKGIPVYSSNRLQRWAILLLNYDFQIEYVNTNSFGQADALSRLIAENIENLEKEDRLVASVEADIIAEYNGVISNLPVTAKDISKAASKDSDLVKVKQFVKNGSWYKIEKTSSLYPYYIRRESLSITQEALTFGHRIIIPKALRSRVLKTLHQAHQGMERMKKIARSYVFWPSIDKDIETLARNCNDCQAAAKNPIKTTLEPWPKTTSAFERVHIDYAGPINSIYYLVIVDSFSKWPEILQTKVISSAATIQMLTHIFARYGNPTTLVSDNGTQFTSDEFAKFCRIRGIKHLRSPPFHPQSNGQAERFVDTFKRALQKSKGEGTTQEALQTFLMSYRSTPCSSSHNQLSPAENFLGRKMRTIMDLLTTTSKSYEEESEASSNMRDQFNRHHGAKYKQFSPGEAVYIKDHRSTKTTWTPGFVIKKLGKVKYSVDCDGKKWDRHANQLRRRDQQQGQQYQQHLLDAFDLPNPILPVNDSIRSSVFIPAPTSPVQQLGTSSSQTTTPRTTTTTVNPASTATSGMAASSSTRGSVRGSSTSNRGGTSGVGQQRSDRPTRTRMPTNRLNMDPTKKTYH